MIIVLLLLVGLVMFVMYMRAKNRFITKTPWQHFFHGMTFSAEEFYKKVEQTVQDWKIPGITIDRESFLESHLFSAKREYLRITRNEFVYFIGAVPLGTGMFVSSWMCQKAVKKHSLENTPFLNKLMGKERENKSFYQEDVDYMYRSAVHTAVLEVVDSYTNASGVRGLTDFERQLTEPKK